MAKTDFKSVDEYLAAQPEDVRGVLERVRGVIRKAVPGAEEVISYQIPAYKLHGSPVIYFAGWKRHYSLYPTTAPLVAALKEELAPYELSKGTIRFPLSQPVPVKLIEHIAKFRAKEVAEREGEGGRTEEAQGGISPARRPRVQPTDIASRSSRPVGVDILSTLLDSRSIMQDSAAAAPVTQHINSRIASRVRALRGDLGMTLDALAARCDVSRSMISLIERGESSPTAVVLEKVATGLGVPLATLFDDSGAPPNPVSRRADRTSWRDPQSGYVRRNVSPANFPSPIQIVEVALPAGARVAYETGARAVSIHQQIWVQEGSIEVTVGKVTHRLAPDDCLAMKLDQPTAFRNRTRKPARYVVVVATERSRTARP